ncbi:ATP-binding cassette domain-containing protein [Clostridium sp. MCC353]|uniref:ABC transporter ATP-binding protein n=1 Tax=Clostridium sp. MCC353 TaxID=2592646 RepID=UPI001C0369BF|nr:ABC transporter ATP-binding protein [Clostridium sp. MCC353]MBT9775231.1 ATP-binding cassette domain-containing protein [Clostridium sp. MCC353]
MTSENRGKFEIEISGVTKSFEKRDGQFLALDEVNLTVDKNEFICVVGPSGCGKTTLMNIIAGLYPPSTGTVRVRGELVTGPGKGKGVVFQQYALYPWLTVEKNVEFGLKMKGVPKAERRETARKYIKIVGLEKFASSFPKELSGGMKQRVAIARAYATNPEVLLMDEPFGALDAQTRAQLQENLLNTWQQERKTCFFITHDVEEAVLLSTKIIIMSAGPGRIREIVDVHLPYPRNQETKLTPEFNEMKNSIWNKVYKEYLQNAK